jgi:hypothetical protein
MEDAPEKYESIPIKIPSGRDAKFSQFWDINTLNLVPGDQLTYFFEVWDNDGVNGSKSTRSNVMTWQMPTRDQMEQKTESNNEKIKDDLESSMKEAHALKEEFDKLKSDLLNKKNPTWEDKKKIDDLLQRQKELSDKVQNAKDAYKENLTNQSDYKNYSPEMQEKQEELQKLFDQVLTPEMKEMMDKLNEMLDQMNKDKTLDQLENQKLSNQDLEKELDRMLSLFKQLEFEQKFNDTKDELNKLAEKQEDLSKETQEQKENKDNKESKDSLGNKQDDIQKEFNEPRKGHRQAGFYEPAA